MSELTTDPSNPDLGHGTDTGRVPQNKAYLVLSEEELAKPFVRPVRLGYVHVGPTGNKYPLRNLTKEELNEYKIFGYTKYEAYPEEARQGSAVVGRFWTDDQLVAAAHGGCRTETTMDVKLAETYARKPTFYGSTYCVACSKHFPVAEFVWTGTDERVGS